MFGWQSELKDRPYIVVILLLSPEDIIFRKTATPRENSNYSAGQKKEINTSMYLGYYMPNLIVYFVLTGNVFFVVALNIFF